MLTKYARQLEWDSGAGRIALKTAFSRDVGSLGPASRLEHRRRGPYTSNLREYENFDTWVHETTTENNNGRKKRTYWDVIGPDGYRVTRYRECWPHKRYCTKKRAVPQVSQERELRDTSA